jgi:ATP-dependent RNA helicase DeaD
MPRRIEDLARNYLREPVTVRMGREVVPDGGAPLVRQTAYLVPRTHTTAALGRVLEAERPKAAIVFCRTRLEVDAVTETLTARGLRAEALHGGMDQEHRSRVVDRLRSGRTELLVATDVAARGLDIDLLTHVVNHDVPQSPETYVHLGRVGQGRARGVAITLGARRGLHAASDRRLTHQPIDRPVPRPPPRPPAWPTRGALAARLASRRRPGRDTSTPSARDRRLGRLRPGGHRRGRGRARRRSPVRRTTPTTSVVSARRAAGSAMRPAGAR